MSAMERRLQQAALKVVERPLLLAASVVVLLAFGAVGLGFRDEVELGKQGFRADLTPTLVVVLVACVITFFVVIATMPKNRVGGPPRKRTNPWIQVLGFATVLGLFLWAAQHSKGNVEGEMPTIKPPGAESNLPGDGGGAGPGAQGAGITLAVLVAIAILGTVGYFLWRNRPEAPIADGGLQSDAEDLRQVIAAGQAAMSGQTDSRSAVIAAYAAMETALARAGLHRRVADTPAEVLSRAGEAGLFGPSAAAAAAELTELFERARFSDRPMPLGAREYAERALAAMDADLEAAIARAAEAKAEASAR